MHACGMSMLNSSPPTHTYKFILVKYFFLYVFNATTRPLCLSTALCNLEFSDLYMHSTSSKSSRRHGGGLNIVGGQWSLTQPPTSPRIFLASTDMELS